MDLFFFLKLFASLIVLSYSFIFFLELMWDIFYTPRRKTFHRDEHYINVLCAILTFTFICILTSCVYGYVSTLISNIIRTYHGGF